MDKIIKYYHEYAYPSANNLYTIMKRSGEHVTLNEVKKVIDEQLVNQLHKKERITISSHMVAFLENENWLMDLLDMQNFSKSNSGYRYILIVCDVFTRKGFGVALKNKNADTVLSALKGIVKDAGIPKKIISDNGSEFLNKDMNKYLKSLQIVHETNDVGYHKALGVIDAFSRTIKNKIYKGFTQEDTTEWVNELPRIIRAYNNSPHRALLRLSPNSVSNNTEAIQRLNEWKNSRSKEQKNKYTVGQLVRKKLAKPVLGDKGYKRIWSLQTYTISDIQGVNAILDNDDSVKLNDLQIISKVPEKVIVDDKVKAVETDRRIDRRVAKEGIDRNPESIKRSLRERRPNQLEDKRYGKLVY